MTRTIYAPDQPPSVLARWASRLAMFCLSALPIALFMHRLFGLPTPVMLNIAITCFAGAALALAMAVIAGLDIWVTGRQGAARVVVASAVSLGLLAVPAGLYLVSRSYPALNDVTTDVRAPPDFVAATNSRRAGSNSIAYQQKFAQRQIDSYPDIKTLAVPRGSEETFELVLQALTKLKLRADAEVPPDEETAAPGRIEFADSTLVLGFVDDVSIRIAGDDSNSRVDVRSASRYGRSDFGRNAERVRMILREISGRVDASVPNPAALAAKRAKKAKAKAEEEARAKAKSSRGGSRASKVRRRKRRPAPSQ